MKHRSILIIKLIILLAIVSFQYTVKAQERTIINDIYTLTNAANGRCLHAKARQHKMNGGEVCLWDFAYQKNQAWRIQYVPGTGLYSIRLISSGLCLSAHNPSGSKPEDGTVIELWKYNKGKNELWQIEKAGEADDEFVIKLPGTNLCIESNGNPNNDLRNKPGCAIDLWNYEGPKSRNEIWVIKLAPVLFDSTKP